MAGRKRTGQDVRCGTCGAEFYVPPNRIERSKTLYCSSGCKQVGSRRQETVACAQCGEHFTAPLRQRRRYCSKQCEAVARSTTSQGRWHNGKPVRLSASGYPLIYEPDHPKAYRDGWVLEHRWLVEQQLGRLLDESEHVHHIDGDRKNNDPSNLQVMSKWDHAALTNGEIRQRLAEWAEYRRRFGPLEPKE